MEYINPKLIKTNPYQPRKQFAPEQIHSLAKSIKEYGLLQPLVVRKMAEGYELIAGERRLRACLLLKLSSVPVIMGKFNNKGSAVLALIENVQRENLNPIEEAQGYGLLKEEFNLTQEEIAQQVGKSRAYIANMLRLLNLAEGVQHLILQKEITMGQAKPLLAIKEKVEQLNLAHEIIKNKLSAREVEKIIKNRKKQFLGKVKELPTKEYEAYLENIIRQRLGTEVKLKLGSSKSKLELVFYSEQDLERILDILDPVQELNNNPPKNFSI